MVISLSDTKKLVIGTNMLLLRHASVCVWGGGSAHD